MSATNAGVSAAVDSSFERTQASGGSELLDRLYLMFTSGSTGAPKAVYGSEIGELQLQSISF